MSKSDDEEAKDPNVKYEMEEKRSSYVTKKVIRVITVVAYLAGVSGAGVLMSLYYIVFWDPQIKGVRPPGYLKGNQVIENDLRRSYRSLRHHEEGVLPRIPKIIQDAVKISENKTEEKELDRLVMTGEPTSVVNPGLSSTPRNLENTLLNYESLPLLSEEDEHQIEETFRNTNNLNYRMDSPSEEFSHSKPKSSREKTHKKPHFDTEEHRKAIRHSQMTLHGH